MGLQVSKQTRRKSLTEERASTRHGGTMNVQVMLREQQILQVWLQGRMYRWVTSESEAGSHLCMALELGNSHNNVQ